MAWSDQPDADAITAAEYAHLATALTLLSCLLLAAGLIACYLIWFI